MHLQQCIVGRTEILGRDDPVRPLRLPARAQNLGRPRPLLGKSLPHHRTVGGLVGIHHALKIPRRVEPQSIANLQMKLRGDDGGNHCPVIQPEIGAGAGETLPVQHRLHTLDLRGIAGINASESNGTLP